MNDISSVVLVSNVHGTVLGKTIESIRYNAWDIAKCKIPEVKTKGTSIAEKFYPWSPYHDAPPTKNQLRRYDNVVILDVDGPNPDVDISAETAELLKNFDMAKQTIMVFKVNSHGEIYSRYTMLVHPHTGEVIGWNHEPMSDADYWIKSLVISEPGGYNYHVVLFDPDEWIKPFKVEGQEGYVYDKVVDLSKQIVRPRGIGRQEWEGTVHVTGTIVNGRITINAAKVICDIDAYSLTNYEVTNNHGWS